MAWREDRREEHVNLRGKKRAGGQSERKVHFSGISARVYHAKLCRFAQNEQGDFVELLCERDLAWSAFHVAKRENYFLILYICGIYVDNTIIEWRNCYLRNDEQKNVLVVVSMNKTSQNCVKF